MTPEECLAYDATGLAALVRDKQVTAIELLDAALRQLERHNPTLNAVTALLEDRSRARIAHGLPEGPFTSVPFLVKDLAQRVAGTPTANGCRLFADDIASADTTLVRRLSAAGLVIAGKTDTAELGLAVTTEPALHGATRNPWALSHTPGGSSGGAAAAVAAGAVPMAQGSDSGGSIRIPASCCGLVGLKPTRDRVPLGPDTFDGVARLTTTHAITRSVRDTAGLLDATAGAATGDPYYCYPHSGSFAAECGRPAGQLRIAATVSATAATVDADVRAAVDDTARLLSGLGHHVEQLDDPLLDTTGLTEHLATVFGTYAHLMLQYASRRRGRAASAEAYARAIAAFHLATRTSERQLIERFDVLVSPTVATPPPPLGALNTDNEPDAAHILARIDAFSPFALHANVTDLPAVSLPLGRSREGPPIGVMLTARLGGEPILIRLAAQLEAAAGWTNHVPHDQQTGATAGPGGETPHPTRTPHPKEAPCPADGRALSPGS